MTSDTCEFHLPIVHVARLVRDTFENVRQEVETNDVELYTYQYSKVGKRSKSLD